MILVDSSAMVAIALGEPEADAFMRLMISTPTIIGAPTLLETRIVLAQRKVRDPVQATAVILKASQTEIVTFNATMSETAFDAFLRFGKGRHPAALNYGDCMSYALARFLDVPILFKGNDFTQTDLVSAIP